MSILTYHVKYFNRLCIFVLVTISLSTFTGCKGKTATNQQPFPNADKGKLVGGGCDGCEIMYVEMPKEINSVDTSAGWKEKGQKLLVKGIVRNVDAKTPAPNVIIYYWQTDNNGYYSPIPGMDDKAKRHGHIRGWVRSDEKGNYSIYTIHPAPYPNANIPAHIHLSIKEPGINNEYYVDELVFDDDSLLTLSKRKALEDRGGSGILKVQLLNGLEIAGHDIILGLNIPGYPKH